MLLAHAEVDERLLGGAHRFLVPALAEAGAGGFDLGPPPQARLARRGLGDGPVDVGHRVVDAADRASGRGAQQQQRRFALGDGTQPGEQTEEETRLHGVGDRLAELHDHPRGLGVGTGIEEQPDRFDRSVALDELHGEVGGRHRLDRGRSERSGRGEVEPTGQEPAQRHAGGERPLDEAGPPQTVEQPPIDAGSPRQQPDHGVLARSELLQGGGVGGPRHPRGEGDRIGPGLPDRLVEGGGDDADTAVRGFDHPRGQGGRPFRDMVDDLVGRDRQRGGVDDQPVDELGDLVDAVRQDASSHDQPQVLDVFDPVDQPAHCPGVEQMGVVDDDGVETSRRVTDLTAEWAQLAAQAQHAGRVPPCGSATTCHSPAGASSTTTLGAWAPASRPRSVVRGRRMRGWASLSAGIRAGSAIAALTGPIDTDSAIRLPSRFAARAESLLAGVIVCQASRPVAGSAAGNT